MCELHTSMRPVAQTLLAVVLVIVAAGAGFAAGWYDHPSSSTSTGGGPATLSVVAAGSLAPGALLPTLIHTFASETPGVNAPVSAQLYEGSTAAATALAGGGQPYDLFVSADYRVIPEDLESPVSTIASWEVVFASDPMVLAYGSSLVGHIGPSNWSTVLEGAGVTLGTPNASADPLGANAIITLELEDTLEGDGGALYGHFFSGGEGALAAPTSAVKIVAENDAGTALSTGEVDAYLIYQSYAKADNLSYLPLSTEVNLGGTDSANVSHYGTASTTVLSGTSTKVVHGAPALFALTVPTSAPDPTLGLAFAAFLLSNATSAAWAADGFVPLVPMWTDQPAHLPAIVSGGLLGGVEALPSYLAALIT
jgi:molybdate/tungstate transport system substrate-binding protein